MTTFKEQITSDNTTTFINEFEFADWYDLNGTKCRAILQDISVVEADSNANSIAYSGIFGSRLQVNCLKSDLVNIPVSGNAFFIDDKMYFVESCADDMGLLTIQLVANER